MEEFVLDLFTTKGDFFLFVVIVGVILVIIILPAALSGAKYEYENCVLENMKEHTKEGKEE